MADNNNFGIQQAPKPMSEDMGNPDGKLGGYNEYDDIVANPDAVKKKEIQASRYIADRTTPERAAQIEQLSKKTKLPKEIVERNFEQVAKLPEADENDYDKLIQTNPGLTEYLRDPNNYAMSKDDIQNIKKIEDNVQDYSMLSSAYDALYTGMGNVNASLAKTPAALLQFAYTPQNIIADYFNVPGLKVEIPSNWINNDLAKYYEEAAKAKAPPELSQSVIDELKSGNYSRAGRVAAVQAISNIPNFGLMMLGGMYSKAAGLGVAGATSAASKLGENVERKDLTSTQKEVSAIATGTFEAAFENLGTFGVLKHWEEAIGKEFGKQVSKEWVKSFAKTLGYSIASEGNEEFWTQVAQDTTDHLLGVEKFTPEEIGKRSLEAGIGGAIFGFGMTSPTGALLGIHANRQKKDALLARDFHIALGDSIEASRSKQRLPEAAKKIVDTIVKNGPVQNVYISPEAIEQYYQKNDLNAVEQMQKADVLAEFEKAKEEGRDMKIPLSDFATKMAPEHYKGLADDIKYDPTKASVNEAKAREEEIKNDLKAIMDDVQKKEAELTPEQKAKQVKGEIAKQLEASGTDESQAILFEKFFQSLGEKTGQDPLEIYKEFPLFINPEKVQINETDESIGVYNQDNLKSFLKKSVVKNEDGSPKVVYHGSKSKFDTFNFEKLGETGTSKGRGFYFTEDKSQASGYGGNVGEYYLDINKPASLTDRTITREQIESLIRNAPDLADALSNWGDVSYEGEQKVLNNALDAYDNMDNDVDIINSIGADVFHKDWENYFRTVKNTLGFDGTVVSDGPIVNYVVFTPEQIKSVNNIGTFDKKNTNTLFQKRPMEFKPYVSPIGFYSQVEAEVGKMDFKSIPSKDLSNRIKGIQGLKKEELEWIGINDWLEAEDRKVTKDEVIAFIRSNGVQVFQTVLSESYSGSEDGNESADWGDPERDTEYDSSNIEEEVRYFLREDNEWVKENTDELTKQFIEENADEDGNYSDKELDRFVNQELERRAYERAEEYVSQDDYYGARFEVREHTSDTYIYGSDEMGWSDQYGNDLGYNLEEAKILHVGNLIEKGKLGGNIADLIKAEDLTWKEPRQNLDSESFNKLVDAYYKKNKKELIQQELAENPNYWKGEDLKDKEVKKDLEKFAKSKAQSFIQKQQSDASNPENSISVKINNDLIDANIERKNGQWALRYINKNNKEKVTDIDSKDIEAAKSEAIQKLLDMGLITSKSKSVSDVSLENINEPTGPSKWERYSVQGGENYREILLRIPEKEGEGSFQYKTHFNEKNILVHIRISDRVDANGKKVLFIEEMQSDWHQQGREKGYATKEDKIRIEELKTKKIELENELDDIGSIWAQVEKESTATYNSLQYEIYHIVPEVGKTSDKDHANLMVTLTNAVLRDIGRPGMSDQDVANGLDQYDKFKGHGIEIVERLKSKKIQELKDEYIRVNEEDRKLGSKFHNKKQEISDINSEIDLISGSIKDAPYKNTEAWAALALKRMIRLAVEQGYDSVGWTTSDVHVERWGTDEFSWKREVAPNQWAIINASGQLEKTFKTEKEARSYFDGLDENKKGRWTVENTPDYFLVGSTRQRGGNAGGVNIEDLARQRGEQLKESGRIVKSEQDLFEVLSDVLGKDKSDRSLRSMADSAWKKMQTESTGTKQPRAEGMQFFYDNLLPKKAAPEALKKLDKSAKVEVDKIATINKKSNLKIITAQNEQDAENGYVDVVSAFESTQPDGSIGYTTFTGTREQAEQYIEEYQGKVTYWKIPITETIKNKVLEGQTLFQKSDQYKGQIKLEAQRAVITFTQSADRSTFFHESGHYFLEVLRRQAEKANAPQEIKDDFNTIMNWFGITDPSQISVEHHEKWAEGFENYIFEGKAPTSALQKAFARFRVWLVGVYKNLSGMKTKFSPEVKEVMDRLLTTEDEIEAKNFEMHREPLFGDPKSIGMTDKEAYDYMNKVDEALEESKAELNRKALAHIDKEQKKIRKEEFDFLRPQVEKEVSKQRIYQSLDKIENNKELKISRESLKAYGDDVPKNIPKKVIAKKGEGQPIEVVASLLGYETHNEFITELTNVREKDELIDELTNREVERQNPDLFQNNLTDEAAKAMHNRKRSQVLRMEFDYLSKNHQGTLKKLTKRLIKRMPSDSEIKAAAKARIGEYSINDLNPKVFLRAEIKAAKDTADAYSKGDFDKAIESKRMEILNHEMFLQAQEANDLVEKANKLYKKLFKKDEELAKVRDLDLVNAGRAMLAKYGLSEKMDRVETYLKQLKQYDPESYENISLLVESLPVEMPAEELKFSDYEKIYDTVDAIWSLAREVRQLTIEGKKVEKKKALEELSTQIDQVSGKSDAFDMKYAGSMTIGESLKNMTLGIRSNLRRVESFVESFDQGSSGPFRKYIWNPVKSAIDTFRVEKKKVTDQYKKIVEDHKEIFDTNPIPAPELNTNFKDKSELIGALLHTGNKSNYRKLIVGRGWGSVDENGVVDDADWKRFIDRMHKEGKLTAKDYQFVQSVWDLFETLKPAAWSAHKKMYGFFPNEVTADSFENEFGKFKGGYAPAVVDPDRSNEALNREQKEIMEKTGNSFMFPTTGRGFTKSRVVYDAPLLIDMRLVGSHIDKVLRFSYVEPAVKEVARLVMDKSFQSKIDSVDKHITTDMLVPWLQRSAQQSLNTMRLTGTLSGLDRFAAYLRGNAGLQIMGLNFINSMQNISGLAMGAVKVKPKYMYSGLIRYMKSPKKYAEEVANRSVFMSTRLGDQVSDILSDVDDILVKPSVTDTIKKSAVKHSRILQTITQNLVDLSVWGGAYDQAIGDGMSESEAVKIADSTVRQTQGSNNPEDVSRLETGPAVARLFTMFYTYFNMQANLLGTEFTKVARDMGLKKGAGRGLYVYTMGMLIPAFLGSVLFKLLSGSDFDDDDDGEYIDDISSQFFFSQIQNLTAMIPVGGAIFNVGINKFNDKPFDDRLTMSPAVTMIESGAGLAAETYRAITDQGNLKRLVKDALSTVGLLTGLPLGPVGKPIGYLMDVNEGNISPSGPIDFTRGLITGKDESK